MRYTTVAIAILFLSTITFIGCADSPMQSTISAQMRHLKMRNSKLEEDYRVTVAECIRLKEKLSSVQQQYANLIAERDALQVVADNHSQLKQNLSVCQAERDELQGQLTQFTRELQSLVGKVEQVTSRRSGRPLISTVSMQEQK